MGYVERDAYAAAVLVARMEEKALAPAPLWDDLTTFDGRPWRGLVDCIAGGTPCQDLSVAGKRVGLDGERSRLFFEQVRVADECEAPLFFWENVGGAARALPAVFAELARHGYVGCLRLWTRC
jgi:DNA (cytosine-5)-methyltransferase 1